MFFNQCTFAGEIATDPAIRTSKGRGDHAPMTIVEFRLRVVRQRWKRETLSIRTVVLGGAADAFAKHKKQGDYLIVSGRLCRALFDGKEGRKVEHHYLVVEDFRFLWGPPGRFVRGHVLVPKDEYERFKQLEEEAGGPIHVRAAGSEWSDGAATPQEIDAAASIDDSPLQQQLTEHDSATQLIAPADGQCLRRRRGERRQRS